MRRRAAKRYIAEVMEYKLVLRISGAGFKEPVTSQARRPVTADRTKSRGVFHPTSTISYIVLRI